MSQFVLTNASVVINGNDISDHVASVTLSYNAELQDNTTMGAGTRSRIGGLKDWKVDLEAHQDFAAAALDSILFPLVGTSFSVVIKPTASSVGTGNPSFTGNAIMESYSPIAGGVGDLAKTPISLMATGTLTRATS